MNHHGMIGTRGITNCQQCLTHLTKIYKGAEKECYDCFEADEWGRPQQTRNTVDNPRPLINVTYKVNGEKTPAFDNLQKQINHINERLDFKKHKSEWI